MDPLVIVLRFVHVVFGALWVGMVAFVTFFLMPALQASGPEGGKVMAAVNRRGFMTALPILAIGALISGFWLYYILGAGDPAAFGRSPRGMTLALGGLAALIAWVIGMTVVRPSMLKAMQLDEQKDLEEIRRLRVRGFKASKALTHLLLFALATMAVARYL